MMIDVDNRFQIMFKCFFIIMKAFFTYSLIKPIPIEEKKSKFDDKHLTKKQQVSSL